MISIHYVEITIEDNSFYELQRKMKVFQRDLIGSERDFIGCERDLKGSQRVSEVLKWSQRF